MCLLHFPPRELPRIRLPHSSDVRPNVQPLPRICTRPLHVGIDSARAAVAEGMQSPNCVYSIISVLRLSGDAYIHRGNELVQLECCQCRYVFVWYSWLWQCCSTRQHGYIPGRADGFVMFVRTFVGSLPVRSETIGEPVSNAEFSSSSFTTTPKLSLLRRLRGEIPFTERSLRALNEPD